MHQFAAGENMKPLPRRKFVELVLEYWAALSEDLIKKSFKNCGLNLLVEGGEDELIHRFKEGSVGMSVLITRQLQCVTCHCGEPL